MGVTPIKLSWINEISNIATYFEVVGWVVFFILLGTLMNLHQEYQDLFLNTQKSFMICYSRHGSLEHGGIVPENIQYSVIWSLFLLESCMFYWLYLLFWDGALAC